MSEYGITITLSKFIPTMPSTGHYTALLYPSLVLLAEKWSFPTVILFPLPFPLIPRTHLSRFSRFGYKIEKQNGFKNHVGVFTEIFFLLLNFLFRFGFEAFLSG